MRKLPRRYLIITILLAASAPLLAQTPQAKPAPRQPVRQQPREVAPSGDVLMLEEIRIEVAPELPTVVVSIPRQRPTIKSVSLAKDANDLITAGNVQVKPRLADLQINRIEEPQKMLAKDRVQ